MSDVEGADWDKRKTPKVIHIYRNGATYLCGTDIFTNTSWPNSKMRDKAFIKSLPVCTECLEARE